MPKVSSKSGIGGKHFLQIIGVLSVLIIALGIGASVYLTSNKEQTTDNRGQAFAVQCEDGELHEAYFRGNKGYYRKYQMSNARGTQIPQFQEVVDLNANPTALPGSGEIKAQSTLPHNSRQLTQEIIRGDEYWIRSIEMTGGKDPKWNEAGSWKIGKRSFKDKISLSNVQAFSVNTFRLNNQVPENAIFWVGNRSYSFNYIGYDVGNPVIALDLVANPTAYPGTGDINAVAYYFNPKQDKFYESFFRGNVGYRRTATANNGQVNHSTYTQFTKFVDLVAKPNAWPGTGTIQTYDAYILCK